jgi:hypothetical protein
VSKVRFTEIKGTDTIDPLDKIEVCYSLQRIAIDLSRNCVEPSRSVTDPDGEGLYALYVIFFHRHVVFIDKRSVIKVSQTTFQVTRIQGRLNGKHFLVELRTFVFEKYPYGELRMIALILNHHIQIFADFAFGVRTDRRGHKKCQCDCNENFCVWFISHFIALVMGYNITVINPVAL